MARKPGRPSQPGKPKKPKPGRATKPTKKTGASRATKFPGVHWLAHKTYRIRGKVVDPRTGKNREIDRILTETSAQAAARERADLLHALRTSVGPADGRMRIGDYAKSWMRSKAVKLDPTTAERYAVTLETHILPAFGDFFYESLTTRDVQAWIDEAVLQGRTLANGTRKPYAARTVHSWFRVLRTMTRDAMDELGLDRDPTLRVTFPEAPDPDEPNALSSDELSRFLEAMRERYPQHFALAATMAFTGLRFCHASALKWQDWDEQAAILRITRKQVCRQVGPITRKKQAPRRVPVEPELATILRWHRRRMMETQAPGLADGWMFPSKTGTLRTPSSLARAWPTCLEAAGIARRFTPHGMRYTFTDLVRRANVDAVVRRALTGHVTETMQQHYSNVGLDEKRSAVASVHQLVKLADEAK